MIDEAPQGFITGFIQFSLASTQITGLFTGQQYTPNQLEGTSPLMVQPMHTPQLSGNQPMIRAIDRPNGIFLVRTTYRKADGSYYNHLVLAKRKGLTSTFDLGDPYVLPSYSDVYISGADVLSSGIILAACGCGGTDRNYLIAMRRRNTVLGVALDNTGKVQVSGKFITSGLTLGAKYYADDDGNLSTTLGEVEIGVAKSTTELVLAVKSGV
jgi:hypothetical protein